MSLRALFSICASSALAIACAEDAPSGPRLAIDVAAFTAEGVRNACYTITVRNGPATSTDIVWREQGICAHQYGDGASSISYVGTCDDTAATTTVTLELEALYRTAGAPSPSNEVAASTWRNPCPVGSTTCSLTADCRENADTAVTFDITIMRDAGQGFFDIAVSFEDVFCSAKLDCVDQLLLRPGGARDLTMVLAFACTAGAEADTCMYLDDVTIDCDGPDLDQVVPTGGAAGNLGIVPDKLLYAAALYHGREQLPGLAKGYWNVALGLDRTKFGARDCSVHLTGGASDVPLAGGSPWTTRADARSPFVEWSLDFLVDGALACSHHPLDRAPAGVATGYTDFAVPAAFDHERCVSLCAPPEDGELWVDPTSTSGAGLTPTGSRSCPFATLTAGLAAAAIYKAANPGAPVSVIADGFAGSGPVVFAGETFPIVLDGITLTTADGAAYGGDGLDPDRYRIAFDAAGIGLDTDTPAVRLKDGALKGFEILNATSRGLSMIACHQGAAELAGVRAVGKTGDGAPTVGYGVRIHEECALTADDLEVRGFRSDGIILQGMGAQTLTNIVSSNHTGRAIVALAIGPILIDHAVLHHASEGVTVNGAAGGITLDHVTVYDTGTGMLVTEGGFFGTKLLLKNSDISFSSRGLQQFSSSAPVELRIEDTEIHDNVELGIEMFRGTIRPGAFKNVAIYRNALMPFPGCGNSQRTPQVRVYGPHGDELYCDDHHDAASCTAAGCGWNGATCAPTCSAHGDATACDADVACLWAADTCKQAFALGSDCGDRPNAIYDYTRRANVNEIGLRSYNGAAVRASGIIWQSTVLDASDYSAEAGGVVDASGACTPAAPACGTTPTP